jgi:hypothetical protein
MNQKLTLNDGTVFSPAHAFAAGGTLWIYIDDPEVTLAEAFEQLNDPEKTARITSEEYGNETIFTGFTELFCIRKEDYGQVNAGLKRAVD